jgi:hypothetical protein
VISVRHPGTVLTDRLFSVPLDHSRPVTYLSFAPHGIAANDVPVAAAVYYHDMYVDRELSMQTARAIRGLRTWVTSEHEHSGLRSSGGAVLGRLIGMARGEI